MRLSPALKRSASWAGCPHVRRDGLDPENGVALAGAEAQVIQFPAQWCRPGRNHNIASFSGDALNYHDLFVFWVATGIGRKLAALSPQKCIQLIFDISSRQDVPLEGLVGPGFDDDTPCHVR